MSSPIIDVLHELEKAQQDLSRLRRRLAALGRIKLPVYWALSPRTQQALEVLQLALTADKQELEKLEREN